MTGRSTASWSVSRSSTIRTTSGRRGTTSASYGLFSISPFGEGCTPTTRIRQSPYILKPGANLRLRYAIYIHDGDTKAADVAGVYHKYVAESGG